MVLKIATREGRSVCDKLCANDKGMVLASYPLPHIRRQSRRDESSTTESRQARGILSFLVDDLELCRLHMKSRMSFFEVAVMKFPFSRPIRRFILIVSLGLSVSMSTTHAQNDTNGNEQTDDVVRIKTELVQTDVLVLDKKGHFVDGIRPEQFDLSLDGNRQTISFFERVTSGSSSEASQLAAVRGQSMVKNEKPARGTTEPASYGRVIFFFLDDVHLGTASLARARVALTRFVEEQMNPDDQVAIVSTSGQIGFLQQLTDNHAVLNAAIKRLNYKQNPEAYTGKTQISEYMASQILDNGNRELFAYLLESIKVEQQMGPGSRHGDHRLAASYSAIPYLRNRLRQINNQGRMTTADTLDALRSLMLSSSALPGRKLLFFLSDGFIINERKSGALEVLDKVTEAAARAGVVVYTMDLRQNSFGLASGVDASTNEYVDLSARRVGIASGELSATREPLQIIADKTGGRAIYNANSIDDQFRLAIKETSDYYVLAWRPDGDEQVKRKSRVKVTVRDRADLTVRLRSNFYEPSHETIARIGKAKSDTASKESPKDSAPQQQRSEIELLAALGSLYSQKELPVTISVGYVDTSDKDMALKVSMQINRDAFEFDENDNAGKTEVDVIGAAIDDRGIILTFKQLLTLRPESLSQAEKALIVWNQQLSVPPGLYQVRVAVRDRKTGRTGSALQWIEIPDMSQGRFDLSSLFLGERNNLKQIESKSEGPGPIKVDVDHKFARSSVLRFQTYVYNAAGGTNGPDVWIEARILRNNQQVLGTSPALVPVASDFSRLPYWTEIPLGQLPAGRYVLQVLATDRVKNSNTSQRVSFSIE